MSNEILKIGVVGVGAQFTDNILPAISSIPNIKIQAICDIDQSKLDVVAERLNTSGYTKIEDMIASEPLDGIIAISDPEVHEAVIRLGSIHNIPVFVEKPPAVSLESIKSMIANRSNSPVMVGLNFGYSESVMRVKELIANEAVGDIISMRIVHCSDKPRQALWNLSLSRSILLAQAIHPLGTLLEFGDIVDLVSVRCTRNRDETIFNATIEMRDWQGDTFFSEVVTGSMFPYFTWNMEVIGSDGIIEVDSLNELRLKHSGDEKWWSRSWRGSPVMNGSKKAGYKQELENFTRAINEPDFVYRNNLDNLVKVYEIMEEMEKIYVRK